MSESLYRPTMISSNIDGCGFLVARLWLKMAVTTQLLRVHNPALQVDSDAKNKSTATRILSLSNASDFPSKFDDYKHEAVIAVIATV